MGDQAARVASLLRTAEPLVLDAELTEYQAAWARLSDTHSLWDIPGTCTITPRPGTPRFVEFRVRGRRLGPLTAPPVSNVGILFQADDLLSSESREEAADLRRRNPAMFDAMSGAFDQRSEAEIQRLRAEGTAEVAAVRLGRISAWFTLFGQALHEGLADVRAVQALDIEPVRWIVRLTLFARTRDGRNYGPLCDYWFPLGPDGVGVQAGAPPESVYVGVAMSSLGTIPWVADNPKDLADDWLLTAGFFAWYGLSRHGW